ncbi:hypothetical protein [Kordiimonas laminariae]|uniref:hypothetical protein n=1 Tax=Kordiimonas laminariae TaxID=2917717 RepID=UPI001FF28B07|nr:hypothetical protein [Kordiimonas laminariae]MCK0068084.1 hypothetical protein [Kordiimonas laminariae]
MISAIFEAFFLATIPVGIFSFFLLGWALKQGTLKHFETREELKAQMEQMKEEKKLKKEKGEKTDHGDFFINKWMTFGGGFYGIMAFFTYVVIELQEIWEFITDLSKIAYIFSNLGLDLLIQFLLNSLYNFIAAIIWFITWGRVIEDHIVIWLAMAYLGYYIGSKQVSQYSHHVWPALARWRDSTTEKAKGEWQKLQNAQKAKQKTESAPSEPQEK